VLDLVVAMAAETQREAGELTRGEACPVGVCLPELVSNEGEPESAWNFEWRGLDYRTPLSAFGPVYLESDVRAAAFAEGWIGAGGNADIFVYVTLSTGMSHTLVIGGRPYGGARGFAIHFAGAELVAWSGPDLDVEVRQNIEVFASGKGLGERYGALVGDRNATARQLIEAAAADPRAERLLENSLLSIASYLGQLVNILDPSLMVIGGGIGSNPEINERLGELTRPFIFADLARDLPIVPAMLGDKACAIGVAALAHRTAPVGS
jgi:glucokinase